MPDNKNPININVDDTYSTGKSRKPNTKAKAPSKKERTKQLSIEFSGDDVSASTYNEHGLTRAFSDEVLQEEDVVLDNFRRLIDQLDSFDPSRVQSNDPQKISDKYSYVYNMQAMLDGAIEYWDSKHYDGEKVIAKALNHFASEIFEAVNRIMYLCYVQEEDGKTVKYDPTADLGLLKQVLYYNELYYEEAEQEEDPTEGFIEAEDIPF